MLEDLSSTMDPNEPVAQEEPKEELLEFDSWWVMRRDSIPAMHSKEIVKADFRGRGLSQMETLEKFDWALEKYGIKLN